MVKRPEPAPDPDLDAKLNAAMPLDVAPIAQPDDRTGPLIFARMIAVMREVTAVGKDGWNEQQKYKFRGIDAAVNALGPALRRHGILPVPRLESVEYRDTLTTTDKKTREVTCRVSYTFYAEDGSSITAVVPGESLDTSDKGTPKAMSVAYRVALLQIFALPTDEPTTDHDGHYHTRSGAAGMSNFERETCSGLLAIPTTEQRLKAGRTTMRAALDQALGTWDCITEHDAQDKPSGSETGPTWGELFAARMAHELDAARTEADLKIAFDAIKARGLISLRHQGERLAGRCATRLAELRERSAETFNHCMQGVTTAADVDALEVAIGCTLAALEAEVITPEQSAEILTVGGERRARLERESSTPAPKDQT